jgi:hypothetical protein
MKVTAPFSIKFKKHHLHVDDTLVVILENLGRTSAHRSMLMYCSKES